MLLPLSGSILGSTQVDKIIETPKLYTVSKAHVMIRLVRKLLVHDASWLSAKYISMYNLSV